MPCRISFSYQPAWRSTSVRDLHVYQGILYVVSIWVLKLLIIYQPTQDYIHLVTILCFLLFDSGLIDLHSCTLHFTHIERIIVEPCHWCLMVALLTFIGADVLMAKYFIWTDKMFKFQAESFYHLLVNDSYEEFRHFSYKWETCSAVTPTMDDFAVCMQCPKVLVL